MVKVADVAMCKPQYRKDYAEIGGRPPAPIRWLPWESILLVSIKVMYTNNTFYFECFRIDILAQAVFGRSQLPFGKFLALHVNDLLVICLMKRSFKTPNICITGVNYRSGIS